MHTDYCVTLSVTVFEVAFPFLGVTVTVTLHDPALRPLTADPDTLQYFAELATTLSDTLEVESTLILAKVAIDRAEVSRFFDTLGIITEGVSTVVDVVVRTVVVVVVVVETAAGSSGNSDEFEVSRTLISGFE